jgi:hypothetical protein
MSIKIYRNKFKLPHEEEKSSPFVYCIRCDKKINIDNKDKFVRGEFAFYNRQLKEDGDFKMKEPTKTKLRINLDKEEINVIDIDKVADVGLEYTHKENRETIQYWFFVCWKCFHKKGFSLGIYR